MKSLRRCLTLRDAWVGGQSSSMWLLALLYVAYFGFIGLYSPYFGPYLQHQGHSVALIAWVIAAMQGTRIVGPPLWGWLADHGHHKVRWLRLALTTGAALMALMWLNDRHPAWVLLFSIAVNLALSGVVPLSDAYTLQVLDHDVNRYARLRVWGSVGFIVTVMLYGQFANQLGFDHFPAMVLLCLGLALVCTLLLKQDPAPAIHHATISENLRWRVFLQAHWLRFGAISFAMVAAHSILYGFYSLYLQHHGHSTGQIGWLWAIGVLAEIVFFVWQRHWFRAEALAVWMRCALLLTALRFACIAAFPEGFGLLAVVQLTHAITFAAHHAAAISWLRRHSPDRLHNRAIALYTAVSYGLGGFLGCALAGRLWLWFSPSAAFWLAAGLALVGWVLAMHPRLVARYEGRKRGPA